MRRQRGRTGEGKGHLPHPSLHLSISSSPSFHLSILLLLLSMQRTGKDKTYIYREEKNRRRKIPNHSESPHPPILIQTLLPSIFKGDRPPFPHTTGSTRGDNFARRWCLGGCVRVFALPRFGADIRSCVCRARAFCAHSLYAGICSGL